MLTVEKEQVKAWKHGSNQQLPATICQEKVDNLDALMYMFSIIWTFD